MKRFLFPLAIMLLFAVSACRSDHKPEDYVNPFICTGGHGHTFPGATVPFGIAIAPCHPQIFGLLSHLSDSIIFA